MSKFSKILIANRSEIAVRIINSIKKQGLKSVAVFAEGDETSNHVKLADESICIGPSQVSKSYLNIEKILDVAKSVGADAIHPGYGFLSENDNFARECESSGITFIGPSADIIKLMGNKAEAKRKMIEIGVPCIPGYQSKKQTDKALINAAIEIGFPVMVKPTAGGGGRGMFSIDNVEDMTNALSTARSEALRSFGSEELIIEKAIDNPLHIEVQVFGDKHGNYIHIGERDCSIQRRHQKVIEESPGPSISWGLREVMGITSSEIIKNIKYVGAGTIEYLVDGDKFYFLEMNTRIQVEHAVTEMVTGLDLVGMQIDVAQGKPLSITQDEINFNGHAIEARLYAENPNNGFFPSPGKVYLWEPHASEGIRVDHSLSNNQEISRLYDPMLAKVIAWGSDRETSRKRLINAINKTIFFGTDNNKQFLSSVLESEKFISAKATTKFLSEDFQYSDPSKDVKKRMAPLVASFNFLKDMNRLFEKSLLSNNSLLNWRSSGKLSSQYRYLINDKEINYLVYPKEDGSFSVISNNESSTISFVSSKKNSHKVFLNNIQLSCDLYYASQQKCFLQYEGVSCVFENLINIKDDQKIIERKNSIKPPMHGNVFKILVAVGDKIKTDTPILIVESMKMEHEILAPFNGIIEKINIQVGEQVSTDTELVSIKESDE